MSGIIRLLAGLLVLGGLLALLWWARPDMRGQRQGPAGGAGSAPGAAVLEADRQPVHDAAVEEPPAARLAMPSETEQEAPAEPATGLTRLELRLWDVEADAPAAGVELVVQRVTADYPWPELHRSHSDAHGSCRLELPAGAVVVLRVNRGHDFLPLNQRLGPLEAGEQALVLRLHPMPRLGLELRVVDEEQRPLPDAAVSAAGGEFAPQRTDADGRVRIEAAERWGVFLQVDKAGFAPALLLIEESTETTVVLQREAILLGQVVGPAGEPLAGVQVDLRAPSQAFGYVSDTAALRRRALSDADGLFTIDRLWPGLEMSLVLESPELAWREVLPPLRSGPNRRALHLQPRPVLRGVVVDEAGEAVAGIGVEAEPEVRLAPREPGSGEPFRLQGLGSRNTITDADGGFVFTAQHGLTPGLWRVGTQGALRRGWRPDGSAGGAYSWLPAVETVTLQAGEQPTLVRLEVRRGLAIRGVLLDPQRKPITEGYVQAMPADYSGGSRVRVTRLDADGAFSIGPLEPGTYRLYGGSYALGVSGEADRVEAGSDGVVIVCGASTRMLGRVVDGEGRGALASVYAMTTIDGESEMWSLASDGDGRFEAVVSQATTWDLFAHTRDGRAAVLPGIRLAEGETREVVLRLEPAAEVRFDDLPEEEGPVEAVLYLRGQEIWRGISFFLEDLRWYPEGELRVELWRRGVQVATRSEVLLAGNDYRISFAAPPR